MFVWFFFFRFQFFLGLQFRFFSLQTHISFLLLLDFLRLVLQTEIAHLFLELLLLIFL